MEFLNINILYLLVIIPLAVVYYILVGRGRATIIVSTTGSRKAPRTLRYWLRHTPIVLRIAALAAIIIALARPVEVNHEEETTTEGIDIVIAMDISGSMLARDFTPDRLSAAKQLATEFVAERTGDRISVVAFAGEAFTQCPLTSDQASVGTMLSRLRSGVVEDGTAIGNGLATAINRLRESGAKSKVVILLTDGVNNRGQISPIMAADIAQDLGIKVYTIGVGSRDKAPMPAYDPFGNMTYVMADVEIDEALLREIAAKTNGQYFRASDNKALKEIYAQINELEKSKVEITHYTSYNELYMGWLLLALILLAAEFLMARMVLNRLPM
ncbi:MAG: VWA domain-containing protein [Alistipes sp.]|jgi:Ca-activated chloride channel family protein|nr:VWA domain-containing protein [Alistipes sp.]MBO7243416.1 VWA domain-containing protein [Alistipes sp.]